MNTPHTNNSSALEDHPSRLIVELTTRCNLSCGMCMKHGGGVISEGDITTRTFTTLEEAMPRLESLVMSGIGEPLLHPSLEHFIARARRLMPESGRIGLQTNGLLVDDGRARRIVGAGANVLCVSVDTIHHGWVAWNRDCHPATSARAIASFVQAAAMEGRRDTRVGIECVATKGTINELPAVIEWAASLGAQFVIVTQLIPYEQTMVSAVTYDTNTDRAIEIFSNGREEAEFLGIDISRYFDVYMKFTRTADEERIVRYVDAMIADAASRGVFLNLKNLMERDEAMLEETRGVFARVEEIARREGMDLVLPETVPCSDRSCDFIEDGSAFVSWDGLVHPCHFLWHRFQCWLGGFMKRVKPRVFGDLAATGILDIWNGAEFTGFRTKVLRYDFPFCYDCSLALCDLVMEEDFIHDCHLADVPCAACLWCTRLFHCLR